MGQLEDALRATFNERVVVAPAIDDAAGRALERAARLRRRRTAVGAFAVVLSLSLGGAGVVSVVNGGGSGVAGPQSVLLPHVEAPPIDVLNGQTITTSGGQIVALTGLVSPSRAWRVRGGWLVESDGDGSPAAEVWWVAESAPGEVALLARGDAIAVGVAGTGEPRIAWGNGGTVVTATVAAGRLVDRASTAGTGPLRPVAIVADGVLLGDRDRLDMWFPQRGPYERGPQVAQRVTAAGRRVIYGLNAKSCLQLIEPGRLATNRSTCAPSLSSAASLYPSPDERWIAVLLPDRVDLYDLRTVWGSPEPTARWPVRASSLAWLTDGSFAITVPDGASGSGAVIRLRVDGTATRTEVPVGGGALVVVPDLRA